MPASAAGASRGHGHFGERSTLDEPPASVQTDESKYLHPRRRDIPATPVLTLPLVVIELLSCPSLLPKGDQERSRNIERFSLIVPRTAGFHIGGDGCLLRETTFVRVFVDSGLFA